MLVALVIVVIFRHLPGGTEKQNDEIQGSRYLDRLLNQILPVCRGGQYAVVHLAEALRYNPEGRVLDSRRGHWKQSLTHYPVQHHGPGVDPASNTNEH